MLMKMHLCSVIHPISPCPSSSLCAFTKRYTRRTCAMWRARIPAGWNSIYQVYWFRLVACNEGRSNHRDCSCFLCIFPCIFPCCRGNVCLDPVSFLSSLARYLCLRNITVYKCVQLKIVISLPGISLKQRFSAQRLFNPFGFQSSLWRCWPCPCSIIHQRRGA